MPKATSQYLLTGLIRAKQDGRLLKGQNCGPKGKTVRYYAHPIARKDPKWAGFSNTTFRADILEPQILQVLQETLHAMPDLRDRINHIVRTELAAQKPQTADTLDQLQQQSAAISMKISRLLDIDSDNAIPEVKMKIMALKNEQQDIDLRIKQVQQSSTNLTDNVDEIVEAVMQRLKNLAEELPNLPIYQLRQVLAAMTHTMTADMVTREVEITLQLPSVAIKDVKTAISELCLQQHSPSLAA